MSVAYRNTTPASICRVTFKVRTYKAAEELARQMCEQMCCKVYYSDEPQDGWFIVSTERFREA